MPQETKPTSLPNPALQALAKVNRRVALKTKDKEERTYRLKSAKMLEKM